MTVASQQKAGAREPKDEDSFILKFVGIIVGAFVLSVVVYLGTQAYVDHAKAVGGYKLKQQIVEKCASPQRSAMQACVRNITDELSSHYSYYQLSPAVQVQVAASCKELSSHDRVDMGPCVRDASKSLAIKSSQEVP